MTITITITITITLTITITISLIIDVGSTISETVNFSLRIMKKYWLFGRRPFNDTDFSTKIYLNSFE
jgi:uncharacterized membrane protein